jgi:two-component system, cell cycle response regulator DivK
MARILLVEDNDMNRDMLSRRLVRKGHEISLAFDGAQGVAMVRTIRPDLVLMDMSLPVMSGYDATRELKTDPDTRHIPVIALTAHAMSGDRDRALQAGCDDYETKPIELPRLLEKIEQQLSGARVPGRDH